MNNLDIKNVKLEDAASNRVYTYGYSFIADDKKYISFMIGENMYALGIYKKEDKWNPSRVNHFKLKRDLAADIDCPLCGRKKLQSGLSCHWFKEDLNELFETLLNHNDIRIKKMFL